MDVVAFEPSWGASDSASSSSTATATSASSSSSSSSNEERKQECDNTRTMPKDIIRYMATFIGDDRDARSFAHSSKANLAGMREYEFNGRFQLVHSVAQSYRSSFPDSSSESFLPLASSTCNRSFGRWRNVDVSCHLDTWRARTMTNGEIEHQPADIVGTTLERIRDWIVREKLVARGGVKVRCGKINLNGCWVDADWSSLAWLVDRVKVDELVVHEDTVGPDDFERLTRQTHWHGIHTLHLGTTPLANESASSALLPSSVTHLTLSRDQPLNKIRLPSGLKYLRLCEHWNQPFAGWPILPDTLEILAIGPRFNHPLKKFRPPSSLTSLIFDDESRFNSSMVGFQLPTGMCHLAIPSNWDRPITELCHLPNWLESLQFGWSFNQPIGEQFRLPTSLRSLEFGFWFDQPMEQLVLPHSLRSLTFGSRFNQPLDNIMSMPPPSLTVLVLGACFNQSIRDWRLPPTLTRLELGESFDQTIGDLPEEFWPKALADFSWRIRQS